MARKKRIIYPEHCYHVMLRGVGGRSIFEDDADRSRFCLLLQYASEVGKFSVHGFCLMDNHVHLLLQPHTEDLSSGIHRLAFRYAQHFNKKVKRQGYLFQGRYKAIAVQHGAYIRRLIRYIHRNPFRAGLIVNIAEYNWSSHHAYIGNGEFTWLKTDLVLSLFSSPLTMAFDTFHKYVCLDDSEAKIELEEIRNSIGIGAYGNQFFVEEFYKTLNSDSASLNPDKVGSQDSQCCFLENKIKISLDDLIYALNKETSVSLEEIQSTCRSTRLVEVRAAFVCLFIKFRLGEISELASFLNRDRTTIVRLEQRLQRSLAIRELVDGVSSQLELATLSTC